MEEELNFPRGGKENTEEKKTTVSEKKSKKRSNSSDFLFGGSKEEKSKKQKKSKDVTSSKNFPMGSSSSLPLGGGGVLQPTQSSSLKKPAFIESLSFQKLAKGTKLLGIVREVAEEYAVVSLPGMLTGFLRKDKTDVSLNRVVSVGMCLAVIVLKATSETVIDKNASSKQPIQKRRIELSVAPALLNAGLTIDMLFTGMHVRGKIRSVEDHGCLIDLGVSGIGGSTTCFLKYESIDGRYRVADENLDNENNGESLDFILNSGRIYDFTIDTLPDRADKDSAKLVQVKLQTVEERAKSKVNSGKYLALHHTIRTLQPGLLVDADVEHHAKNGVCVSFLGNVYRGSIESSHLGGYLPDTSVDQKLKLRITSEMWWKSVFTGKNRVIKARLIAIDPATKLIRLSLLPHILSMSEPPLHHLPSPGTIIENARVVRMDAGVGALLALPSNENSMEIDSSGDYVNALLDDEVFKAASILKCAYVHISKAFDGKERTPDTVFAKKFALNHIVPKLRILSTSNWFDNVASCTTADSVVSSAVLTYTDIKAGSIYKAVPILANLDSGGLLVQLSSMGMKGIVPSNHIFDKASTADEKSAFRQKVLMEKYKVGNKIDVRCLSVNSFDKKCILTAKRSLLTSDTEDPVVDYADIKAGRIATGFISTVSKSGISVTFYNGVFGSVSARRLVDELGIEDPTLDFKVGDVIKVRVQECSKRSNGNDEKSSYFLDLSLDLNAQSVIDSSQEAVSSMSFDVKAGSIVPEKSMKILEIIPSKMDSLKSTIFPGHFLLSVKTNVLLNDGTSSGTLTCKLPFDQVFDSFHEIDSAESLDTFATKNLKVGKKITQKAMIISTSTSRSGQLVPTVTLKPSLIESHEKEGNSNVIIPSPQTPLYMGAYVHGFCARLDSRYGAFIRFFDNLTGIIPKLKGGLDIGLFDTVLCKVVAMDVTSGKSPKILLKRVTSTKSSRSNDTSAPSLSDEINPGDVMGDVRVDSLNFARANVVFLDKKFQHTRLRARVHVTMANPISGTVYKMPLNRDQIKESSHENDEHDKITRYHPFHSWSIGSIIKSTKCVAVHVREGITYVELTNREDDKSSSGIPFFVEDPNYIKEGDLVSGIITAISKRNQGVWVQICAGCTGFIPGLELSSDIHVLNNLRKYFKLGGRVDCRVLRHNIEKGQFKQIVRLSVLSKDIKSKVTKPSRGDIVIGRVNRNMRPTHPPALMIEFLGGFIGRCDITELEENDDWENMPLGRYNPDSSPEIEDEIEEEHREDRLEGEYHHGLYVFCRVLTASGSGPIEVSLRESRLEGDLDDDEIPEEKEIVHAYVVTTNKKGCFLRLSRFIEGRVMLKELSDSFLPDPVSMFPPGRLVVGKVKKVIMSKDSNKKAKKLRAIVDLDLRESVLLQDQNKLSFDDIKEGEKYNGVVTRIEAYGVFVRIENSQVSGLSHLSECSDDYIKNLSALYDPGDLVKVMVIKIDTDNKKIGLSMKASHFEDDSSNDDSIDSNSGSEGSDNNEHVQIVDSDEDSDDENFTSTIADEMKKMEADSENESMQNSPSEGSSDDDNDVSDSSSETSSIGKQDGALMPMDTDVGFDWGTKTTANDSEDEEDESSSDDASSDSDEDNEKRGHKSRKKVAAKRQEEKYISKMEQRLADGTAEENPETVADFERLIATDPNSSENWIKFMAYHLSLADIESARSVAKRAFDRIEFREEGEKLNVWMALVTVESKYGTPKSFSEAIDNAAQHNNPKQVYIRVCELLEKEVTTSHGDSSVIAKADEMFEKMCKKFRSKKTVWISFFKYLLKSGRYDEAHSIWKRSVKSLPDYKHVETMSKFAQLEYEHGSAERARTIFDALLEKHPKRMDLVFVYVDKEVKHGDLQHARKIFERIIDPKSGKKKFKFNDKQMKSLFKKWYRIEDENGDDDSRTRVKLAAKEYVEKTTQVEK